MKRNELRTGVGSLAVAWLLMGVAFGTILMSSKWDCGPGGAPSSERATTAAGVFSLVALLVSLIVLVPATHGRRRAAAIGAGVATLAALLALMLLAGSHVVNDCDIPVASRS